MGVGVMELFIVVFAITAVIILPLVLGAWVVVKLVSGGKDRKASEEESQIIQELYHGLGRMEQRVEALETLLLERERKEARHDV